ncbi:hypothetical protein D3C72_2252300 [compost metagenome]
MEGTGKHETMGFVETRLAKADPVPDRTGCDRVFGRCASMVCRATIQCSLGGDSERTAPV